MGAGQDDPVRSLPADRFQGRPAGRQALLLRGVQEIPLHEFHESLCPHPQDPDTPGPAVHQGIEVGIHGGTVRGQDGDSSGSGGLGRGLDRGDRAHEGDTREALPDGFQGRLAGGVAGQDDQAGGEPVGDPPHPVDHQGTDLLPGLAPVGKSLPVRGEMAGDLGNPESEGLKIRKPSDSRIEHENPIRRHVRS